MSDTKHYATAHLFIDETGTFTKASRNEFKAVGGVVILGELRPEDAQQLKGILKNTILEAGGAFPQDLHGSTNSHNRFDKDRLMRLLQSGLQEWCGSVRSIMGISIEHEEDIWGNYDLITERARDNRYQLMLRALLQQLLFVDSKLYQRFSLEARINITIASRVAVLNNTEDNRKELERFGYRYSPDRKHPSKLVVRDSFAPRELGAMLQACLLELGALNKPRFDALSVEAIDYNNGTSPAGLYLADLYLMQLRQSQIPYAAREVKGVYFTQFRRLHYGGDLEKLKHIAIATASGHPRDVLRGASELQCDDQYVATIATALRRRAMNTLAETDGGILTLLQDANRLLDTPGRLEEGRVIVDEIRSSKDSVVPKAAEQNWEVPYLLFQAEMTIANHFGAPDHGEVVWRENSALLGQLRGHGLDGLRLEAEIRNRRAVSLLDQFRFAEAEELLKQLVSSREKIVAEAAAAYSFDEPPGVKFPDYELGACLGTLGQVIAIANPARKAEARDCFLRAEGLFDLPKDKERQWLYLGHLACDRSAPDKELWRLVCAHVPLLEGSELIGGDGNQFVLALQLKGIYCFSETARIDALLRQYDSTLKQYSEDSRALHPFGLIHQAAALCAERLLADSPMEWRDFIEKRFAAASMVMKKGGPLLRLLATACNMRHRLLRLGHVAWLEELELEPTPWPQIAEFVYQASSPPLGESYKVNAAGRRIGHFGSLDPGDATSPRDRAEALLQGIRFNHW